MAEINVETKKNNSSSIWLWVVLALVVAAVIYFLTRNKDKTDDAGAANRNTTSYVQPSFQTMIPGTYIVNAA